MLRTSKVVPSCDCNSLRVSLLLIEVYQLPSDGSAPPLLGIRRRVDFGIDAHIVCPTATDGFRTSKFKISPAPSLPLPKSLVIAVEPGPRRADRRKRIGLLPCTPCSTTSG